MHDGPDADDGRRRSERVAIHFDQDAAHLEMAVDDVVGPLECDTAESLRLEGARHCDADCKRESRQEARALLETPAEGKREAASGDRGPCPAAPSAPRCLPFGRERHTVDIAFLRPAQEFR